MSKVIPPLLAVAIVGLGAGAFWQNQQLSAERQRTSSLSDSLSKLEAKAAELEKEAANLRELKSAYQSESEQLRKRIADRSSGAAAADQKDENLAQSAAPGEPASSGGEKKDQANFMQTMAKMFKDPEMKKVMRGQQAMGIRMMYADLAKELSLTPDETDLVMELLTDRQLAMTGKSMELMDGATKDETKMAEVGKDINTSREEYDKQLANILGQDKHAKLQEYERTLGERAALNQLQQQMTTKGISLEESQRQNLLQVMVDERLKAPATPWDPGKPDVAAQMKALKSDDFLNGMIDQQKKINTNVVNRARQFLTPDQLNALQQSQEQFLQMQQFGMKMGREMFNNK